MARASGRGGQGMVRGAVVDHGNPSVMHGAKATSSIGCTSDPEVLEGLIQAIPAHEFLFGRLTGLTPKASPDAPVVGRPAERGVSRSDRCGSSRAERATHHAVCGSASADRLGDLHRPLGSASHGVSQRAQGRSLTPRSRAGKKPTDMDRSEWWTASDGRALEEEVEKAKRGLLFLGIK
ncbi:hypothetical protein JVU11DRAFT_2953 [Chiua virens]|nr:hypothetical protein JVU11DRAFT_2953 [Chiua virens]